MTVADYQSQTRGFCRGIASLLGADRLGRIERALVQRRMGADRQRHHAKEAGDHRDRTTGDAKLPEIHNSSFLIIVKGARNVSQRHYDFGLRDWPGWCLRIARN